MKIIFSELTLVTLVSLVIVFLGAGCTPVDGQPVRDRPLSTPLNDTSSDVSNTEVPANPDVVNKEENTKIQKFVEKKGKYQFELPNTWLTPRAASIDSPEVFAAVGTVQGKQVVGDFSVYIAAVNAANGKEAAGKYIKAGQGEVKIIDEFTSSIPGGKVPVTRYLNKRGMSEDEYVVFTLQEGSRYVVMTVAQLNTPGYEDGVQMILQTLRSL